jgi:hypothetical protein
MSLSAPHFLLPLSLSLSLSLSPLHIVVFLIKIRTVEPEKQPLLANVFETALVSR